MIKATMLLDSVSEHGFRPRTFVLRYPKFIHGELMTHRVFSRNASSSRAVPTSKLLEEVRSDDLRAGPVYWGLNQRGMQAASELPPDSRAEAIRVWKNAALAAAAYAESLDRLEAHKQVVNRILEPYSHINVVVTSTEFDNFFGLRLHKDAQPEMRALAEEMWKAQGESSPRLLRPGEWHLPFVDDETVHDVRQRNGYGKTGSASYSPAIDTDATLMDLIKVSVARCARVSFRSFMEPSRRSTVEEDLEMYAKKLWLPDPGGEALAGVPIHASPAEHQLTPDRRVGQYIVGYLDDSTANPVWADRWHYGHQHGNVTGWRQFRKMLPGEAVAPMPEGYS